MSQHEKKVSNTPNSDKVKIDKSHKHQQKLMIGTIIILVFTIISFVLVPAMAGSGGGSGSLVFGKYGKKVINFQQGNYFSQQVESINNMYRDSLGGTGNVDFLRQLIWRSAFNQTVVRTAILEEMNESGFNVSSKGIDRGIVESGMFSENGRFDEDAYMSTSASRIKEIRTSLNEDLTVQTFYIDTIYNQKRSTQMMDFLLDMGNPEKNFVYASLPYSSFPDDQVIEYGNKNSHLFEEIQLKRITLTSSEEEASTILKKLEAGEQSFEDLAKTYSTDSYGEDGGTMGATFKYTLLTFLNEDQASQVMSLTSGQHSTVIESEGSWYIFMADSDTQKPDFSSDVQISTVRSYMEREEVGLIEDFLMGQAEEMALLAHTSNLNEAAAEFGALSNETGFIAPVYGNVPFIINSPGNNKDSSLLSAAAYSDEFFEKVFVLKNPGETSQPMVLDRSVVVFSLLDEQEGFSYPDEYKEYIRAELANELSQYQQSELQNIFMSSPKLKDNFTSTYNRVFAES